MRYIWLAALVIGCGGGSGGLGVDGNKLLVALNTAEYTAVCEYLIASLPRRTVMCPEGNVTVGSEATVEECATSFEEDFDSLPDCEATVADYQRCVDATAARTDEQICDPARGDDITAACAALVTPACGLI
jgi:hypothetical protein